MKKLIPAIVMLLVSAVVLSTASYAWFTTSTSVSADGMKVTAQAPTSVLISGQYYDTNTKDNVWTDYTSFVDFAKLVTGDNKITAVSSSDGFHFWEPKNCTDTTGSMEFGTLIQENTKGNGSAYMDYVVTLQNTSNTHSVQICIEEIELNTLAIADAVRVAIIVGNTAYLYNPNENEDGTDSWVAILGADGQPMTTSTTNEAGETETKIVYAQGPLSAAKPATQEATAFKANAEGATIDYSNIGTKADGATPICTLKPIGHSEDGTDLKQNYQQITIRIWIEGQDAACVTANAGLAATLNVTFGIYDSEEYVAPTT